MTAPVSLFVSWQNPATRQWFVVGKLSDTADGYTFGYTWGADLAQEAGFSPLDAFPDLDGVYESETLFPTFSSRLPPESRPDYEDFVSWLHLPAGEATPLLLLDRHSGAKQTDNYELFRAPEPDGDGNLYATFFLRGLRHRDTRIQESAEAMSRGTRLYLAPDDQNGRDPQAVLLRTEQDIFVPGYLPRYLAGPARMLLRLNRDAVTVTVEKVNPAPAPIQLRLLCRFSATDVPRGLPLFTEQQYRRRVIEGAA